MDRNSSVDNADYDGRHSVSEVCGVQRCSTGSHGALGIISCLVIRGDIDQTSAGTSRREVH